MKKIENYYNKIGAHSAVNDTSSNANLLDIPTVGIGSVNILGLSPLPSPSGFNDKIQFIKQNSGKDIETEQKPKEEIKKEQPKQESSPFDELNSIFENASTNQTFKTVKEPTMVEKIKDLYVQSFNEEKRKSSEKNTPEIPQKRAKEDVIDFTNNYNVKHDYHLTFLGQMKESDKAKQKTPFDAFSGFEFFQQKEQSVNEKKLIEVNVNDENKENIKIINNASTNPFGYAYPTFSEGEFKKHVTETKMESMKKDPNPNVTVYTQKDKDIFDLFN